MDHIEFDFDEDFIVPLISFLERCGLLEYGNPYSKIVFPNVMFLPPEPVISRNKDRRRERNILTRSYDTNILKDNELMSSKLAKRSILGF